MRDRVFIIWSGNNEVAINVKRILERDHRYVCTIGGNYDNNSKHASISDTVIQQMRACNQAIVIFQNKDDGDISKNLFFELGYSYASYGATKVHCVKRECDNISLPTDFDNSFIEPVKKCENDEVFAEAIVDYFITRQKMSVNENKMSLIDNRYKIHEKLNCHYTELGSKCSDYELAQYILYYMQAAFLFDDIPNINNELLEFKKKNAFLFSRELELSVGICLEFFKLVLNIKEYEDTHEVYIDENTFFESKKAYTHYLKSIADDDLGIFDEWAKIFVSQHLNFVHMLFGNNLSISQDLRCSAYEKSVMYGELAFKYISVVEDMKFSKENNDDRGILALFKAYITRNMYICKKFLNENDAIDWLKRSVEERELLKNIYDNGTLDSQIYSNFCMEYYLALISYIDEADSGEIDDFDILMHKRKISEYLEMVEKSNDKTAYLQKLRLWCDK